MSVKNEGENESDPDPAPRGGITGGKIKNPAVFLPLGVFVPPPMPYTECGSGRVSLGF